MRSPRRPCVAAATLALALVAPSASTQQADSDALRREIQSLRQLLEEMRVDLQEIRESTQRRSVRDPVNAQVDVGRYPFRGDRKAPLTVVEFSDYQCPFCAQHARETAPSLEREYVSTGKLKVVVIDLPLERPHPLALRAAEAAACAREQGRFWPLRERFFASPAHIEPLSAHASALELDPALFEECLSSGRNLLGIRQGAAEAARLNIVATPHFLIGRSERDGTAVRVAATLAGARPLAAFREVIERLLAEPVAPPR